MSLLLSEGHWEARRYPVAVVWSEVRIVRERNAMRRQRDTALMQMTVGSLFSKKASDAIPKLLDKVAESD